MRLDHYIGGAFAPSAGGKRFPVENPATEEILGQVALAEAADVDRAVAAAKACFESDGWQKLEPRRRGQMLTRAADLLESRLDEFAKLETLQNGKPLFESKIDVAMTVETLRYYAGWADKITGATLPVGSGSFVYTLKEPLGVVGAIVPWNFPLNLASWKFAPGAGRGLHRGAEARVRDAAHRAADGRGDGGGGPPGRRVQRGGGRRPHGRRGAGPASRTWTRSRSRARPPSARASCARRPEP